MVSKKKSGVTTIQLPLRAREALKAKKRGGESYAGLLKRMGLI